MEGVNFAAMDADEQLRRDLIVASALFHAPPPGDRVYANCFRVLRHALHAAGLWESRLNGAFHGDDEGNPDYAVVTQWYSTLINLTRHEPVSERLLQGQGNFTVPAGAYFTACWLTPAGYTSGERLLTAHPGWWGGLTAQVE